MPIVEALTVSDIKSVFRQLSGAELALPDLAPIDWGILDYLGWIHPSGTTAFMVMLPLVSCAVYACAAR